MTGSGPSHGGRGGAASPPGEGGRRSGRRVGAVLGILGASLLLALALGSGQGRRGAGAGEDLATLRPGQWVQMEGALGPDSTALCHELRILTGDFLDDDWVLKGLAQSVDSAKGEFGIGGVRVRVSEDTRFDSPKRRFRGLRDLLPGLLVEVEGTYLKNRTFLALEVDDESDEIERTPWGRTQVLLVGRVERVDTRRRVVGAMGLEFQVTEKTRIRSAIQ